MQTACPADGAKPPSAGIRDGTSNFVLCDGSVRSINYSVDLDIYGRLGNRKDGEPIDASKM